MQLHDLPIECLRQVLAHLPLSDRLRLEMVCRRWMAAMPYNDKAVTMNELPWMANFVREMTYHQQQLTQTQRIYSPVRFSRALECLLCRVGHTLRSLKLEHSSFRVVVNQDVIDLLKMYAPRLERLSMYGCLLHYQAFTQLPSLLRLRHVNMESGALLDAATNDTPQLSREEFVHIYDEALGKVQLLEEVLMGPTGFLPTFVSPFVTAVSVNNMEICSLDLARLCANCPHITRLAVGRCRKIDDFACVAQLTKLTKFIAHATEISDLHLAAIAENCVQLKTLRIDACSRLSASYARLKQLTRLRSLWLGPTDDFGDKELAQLARHGTLECIMMSSTRVTDAGLRLLAHRCHALTEIGACRLPITDEGIRCLLIECPKLRVLNIQATNIGNETLTSAGRFGHALQELYMQDCNKIDEAGFMSLMYERRQQSKTSLLSLSIYAGGFDAPPVGDSVIDHLLQVNIKVTVQRPLMALGFV